MNLRHITPVPKGERRMVMERSPDHRLVPSGAIPAATHSSGLGMVGSTRFHTAASNGNVTGACLSEALLSSLWRQMYTTVGHQPREGSRGGLTSRVRCSTYGSVLKSLGESSLGIADCIVNKAAATALGRSV